MRVWPPCRLVTRVRPRIDRELETCTHFRQTGIQLLSRYPRLHHGVAIRRVHANDGRHCRKGDANRLPTRHNPALDTPGTRAIRYHRYTVLAAHINDGHDIRIAGRKSHRPRQSPAMMRGIMRMCGQVIGIRRQTIAQCFN